MKRIIIHWTAGRYTPNQTELEHYHFLIDGNGHIINGKFKPEDNLDCKDNIYAAHTGGGNTGSIGIALCGMFGFKSKFNQGLYPITRNQCQVLFRFVADLSKKYSIPISPSSVFTHFEFGLKNPTTSSFGKIDINFLPPFPHLPPDKIGDFIRHNSLISYK